MFTPPRHPHVNEVVLKASALSAFVFAVVGLSVLSNIVDEAAPITTTTTTTMAPTTVALDDEVCFVYCHIGCFSFGCFCSPRGGLYQGTQALPSGLV